MDDTGGIIGGDVYDLSRPRWRLEETRLAGVRGALRRRGCGRRSIRWDCRTFGSIDGRGVDGVRQPVRIL